MKYLLLVASLISITAFANLDNGDTPKMLYNDVSVMELKSATVESRIRNGYFKGVLTLKLIVEGNVCGNPAASLGKLYDWRDEGREIKLLTGTQLPGPDFCTEQSIPVEIPVKERLMLQRGGKHVFYLRVLDKMKTITVSDNYPNLQVTIN